MQKKHYFLFLSAIAHSLILVLCLFSFKDNINAITTIPSYLTNFSYSENRKTQASQAKTLSKMLFMKTNKSRITNVSNKATSTISSHAKKINTSTYSQLLTLIHQALANYENYPEEINPTNKSLTLSMKISPDGTLSNLHIAKSSGNVSVDQSALQAAREASPIANIKNLLKKPENFSVDIIFA